MPPHQPCKVLSSLTFSNLRQQFGDTVVNNLMYVSIDRRALKTTDLQSETCGFSTIDTILFSKIQKIVGAQLVTLSFSPNR